MSDEAKKIIEERWARIGNIDPAMFGKAAVREILQELTLLRFELRAARPPSDQAK